MSAGRVESVYTVRLGSTVAVTLVGDGTSKLVQVGYSVDFSEDGGQFRHVPTGDVYSYASADPDAETVTLAAGLPVGKTFTEGDALDVYPEAEELHALVRLDDADEDDPVTARVPHALRPLLAEGTRDPASGEPVAVDAGAEGWEVTNLRGAAPVIGDTLFRTGESGLRVEISPHIDDDQTALSIDFYSGHASETVEGFILAGWQDDGAVPWPDFRFGPAFFSGGRAPVIDMVGSDVDSATYHSGIRHVAEEHVFQPNWAGDPAPNVTGVRINDMPLRVGTGGRDVAGIQFGTFTGTDPNGNFTVTHGLGVTPVSVVATPSTDLAGAAEGYHATVSNLTATTFALHVNNDTGGNVTAQVKVHWIAIA